MGIPITRQQEEEGCFTAPPTVVNSHLLIFSQETKPYTHSRLWPYSERGFPLSLTHVQVSRLLQDFGFVTHLCIGAHPTTQIHTMALAQDPGVMCSPPPPQPPSLQLLLPSSRCYPRIPITLSQGLPLYSLVSPVFSAFSQGPSLIAGAPNQHLVQGLPFSLHTHFFGRWAPNT